MRPNRGFADTDDVRRALMGRVRQSGTTPELAVREACRHIGERYRVNQRGLPGSPDLSSKRHRWAIFVHGCYWHQHTGCQRATRPKRHASFWAHKFSANRLRDARVVRSLRAAGFRVLVVWECQTSDLDPLTARIRRFIESAKRRVS